MQNFLIWLVDKPWKTKKTCVWHFWWSRKILPHIMPSSATITKFIRNYKFNLTVTKMFIFRACSYGTCHMILKLSSSMKLVWIHISPVQLRSWYLNSFSNQDPEKEIFLIANSQTQQNGPIRSLAIK